MEYWLLVIIGVLMLLIIVLLYHHISFRRSIREIQEELTDILSSDTNNLLCISSSDRWLRSFTAELNIHLSKLRQEQHHLQSGNQELKNAITNISHDLRTPLTAISGYLDLLEQEEKSDQVAHYVSVIAERTEALTLLTEELFRYSIITSTLNELHMEQISLNGVLEESIAAFYGALTKHHIVPVISMPQVPVIRCLDKASVKRIFSNILHNAIKYAQNSLTISLTEDGILTFTNTAIGMDNLQAEQLFDRFYTVESARNSTGLGLSIAKVLTEAMGGSIEAICQNEKLSIQLHF
ncbi:sensor histidine kinase [Anaerosporobacter faecicola]|uniref:sensor histidine kinase n=1 Tax=Anaerosporobacter faecicola TaxID=2718714 RepID=UPI00143B86E8|nr:HAMP domain-containing sensor histidine kinase [Anaerosporobacter faecicola]